MSIEDGEMSIDSGTMLIVVHILSRCLLFS